MIDLKNLYFRYDTGLKEKGSWTLNNVNLQLKKGKYIVILGENGSGKSTLAKQLNVLLLPSKGTVTVDDLLTTEVANLWKIRDRVSMVFQNPNNQLVGSTVEEDIAFGMENRKYSRAKMWARLSRYLELASLVDKRKQNPIYLSGGQKQKLAIAGTLATDPEYLILDEATAMLDTAARNEVMKIIQQVCENSKTTVINITHFVEEALNADEIYVVHKGKVVMAGTPNEVFRRVDELKTYHLGIPMVTQIGYDLQKRGYPIKTPILSSEELVTQLKQLRNGNG